MKCPKCGSEQPAGSTECMACGIIFARWKPPAPRGEAAAPALPPPLPPSAPPSAPGNSREAELQAMLAARQRVQPAQAAASGGGNSTVQLLKICGGAVLALMALFSWRLMHVAKGLAPAEHGASDLVGGFVFTQPEGWSLVTPDTRAAEPRNFPRAFDDLLGKGVTRAVMFPSGSQQIGAEILLVNENPGTVVLPNQALLPAMRDSFLTGAGKSVSGAEITAAEISHIDNLPVYRFDVEVRQSRVAIRQLVYMIPGARVMHSLHCQGLEPVRADFGEFCDGWAGQFRVLQRPDRLPFPLNFVAYGVLVLMGGAGLGLFLWGMKS